MCCARREGPFARVPCSCERCRGLIPASPANAAESVPSLSTCPHPHSSVARRSWCLVAGGQSGRATAEQRGGSLGESQDRYRRLRRSTCRTPSSGALALFVVVPPHTFDTLSGAPHPQEPRGARVASARCSFCFSRTGGSRCFCDQPFLAGRLSPPGPETRSPLRVRPHGGGSKLVSYAGAAVCPDLRGPAQRGRRVLVVGHWGITEGRANR